MDLERHILDVEAQESHFLLCARKRARRAYGEHSLPERPMGSSGTHDWWYRCLANAGIVAEGTTGGEHMHKARHTAGQRVLDTTGNLKAAQKLLGHASIQTTGDVYSDWDIDALTATMAQVLTEDDR
jgi:integrase